MLVGKNIEKHCENIEKHYENCYKTKVWVSSLEQLGAQGLEVAKYIATTCAAVKKYVFGMPVYMKR